MILVKRYVIPLVISVVLYSAVYFLFGIDSQYMNIGLVLSVLLSYLIRICDDMGDYEKDKEKGRAPITPKVLAVLCIITVLAFSVLTVVAEKYLMFIPLLTVLSQFLISEAFRDIIKPIYMPSIVICLVFSFFTPSFWLYVAVPILVVSDIALIVYKRHGENHDISK